MQNDLQILKEWQYKVTNSFIRDADCTKDTPIVLGVPDIPIYGNGVRIKPRVDGGSC